MDVSAYNIAGAAGFGALVLVMLWLGRPRATGAAHPDTLPMHSLPREAAGHDLLHAHRGVLRAIEERTRFSSASFERDCLGFLQRVARHVECAAERASEIPAPSRLGLLLEQTRCALGYRQALLLPPDAPPEDIEHRSYRWTLGVVLLCVLRGLRPADEWQSALQAPDMPARREALRSALAPWLDIGTLAWLFEDDALVQQLWATLGDPGQPTLLGYLVERARCATLGLPEPAKPRAGLPARSLAAVVGVSAEEAPAPPVVVSTTPAAGDAGNAEVGVARTAARPKPEPQVAVAAAPDRTLLPAVDSTAQQPSAHVAVPTSQAELADGFMAWLRGGVADQSVPVNQPDARVHFISDGMVLVAPAVFNDHALALLGPQATPAEASALAREVQKAVYAADWHQRGPQGSHLHRFQFVQSQAGAAQSTLRGLLIQNPQRFMAQPAPLNPALSRLM